MVFSSNRERRREHRFQPNQSATVRVLALRPGPILSVCVLDISRRGMRLRSKRPVPVGTPIEIESDHSLAIGSVCRCEAEQLERYSFQLGVKASERSPDPWNLTFIPRTGE